MPNIIEQQDLLKGIPDNRLAMLLQNPVGDIPPFLVAAEAQRRQSIRQQFSQNGNNESVVDSLTRQLSPQRVQGNAEATPPVPATPDMQGVAALQQQQQMMQMAQQAQGMAGGGPVRRYGPGGFIPPSRPSVDALAAQATGGVMAPEEDLTFLDQILRGVGRTTDFVSDPFGFNDQVGSRHASEVLGIDPESIARRRQAAIDAADPAKIAQRQSDAYTNAYASGYRGIGTMPGARTEQQAADDSRTKQVYQQYAASRLSEPEAEQTDEYRERLAKLYDQEGPSDWEKSQKWFAMAGQFLDPSKTTMQSVAGAGQEFAGAMSEQERAERLARLDKEKALYEYDLSKASSARDSAMSERKVRTDIATQRLDDMSRRFYDIDKDVSDTEQLLAEAKITPEAAAIKLQRLKEEKDALGAGIGTLEQFLQDTYGFQTIPTVDTANNRIR